MDIMIKISSLTIECKLLETETAKEIYKMLPIKSQINTWGDEIYFDVPANKIKADKTAKEVFELGEIAFWNQGNAIAGGFGPTPVSKKDEIRLISPANHWANAKNPQELKKLGEFKNGENIEVLKC